MSLTQSVPTFCAPVHGIAFQFGPVTIYWYGILAATGFLLGFWTAARRGPRDGLPGDSVTGVAPWLIIGALLGARSYYVVTHWQQEFAGLPFTEIFKVRSGLVFYGGLIGASVGTILYTLRYKVPIWKLGDALAPSIALGHAFGRIGCLMTGCCYGRTCSLPWAIHFPQDHATGGAGVHPTQIYESLLNLFLWAFLEWFHRRKKFDGQIFGIYLMAYSILRAAVESFRGDYSSTVLGGVTAGQVVSGAIFLGGLSLLLVQSRRAPKVTN